MNGTAEPPPVNEVTYQWVLPIVCILGIVGNIMNMMTLASRRLRAVSYMYLRALAIADLLCMVFALAFAIVEIAEGKFKANLSQYSIFRVYRTHFMLSLINWAVGTGVCVVVALSLERYISIIFPMHFRTWNSPQRASKAIAIAYVFPFILYLPYAIARYQPQMNVTENGTVEYTYPDSEWYNTIKWSCYKWFREGMLRFGPIILISILNVQIMLAFRKRQKMFVQLTKRKEQSGNKDDTLLYMLGGTVILFFICNVPAAINLILIDETRKKQLDFKIFRAVANILEIANHASQFYVFCACSTDYRTTFLQKFPCFKRNYANRATLRSIVKRTQSIVTRDRESTERTTSPKRGTSEERFRHEDTVDVHLEGEGDSERESDSLLQYKVVANSNGSTFL